MAQQGRMLWGFPHLIIRQLKSREWYSLYQHPYFRIWSLIPMLLFFRLHIFLNIFILNTKTYSKSNCTALFKTKYIKKKKFYHKLRTKQDCHKRSFGEFVSNYRVVKGEGCFFSRPFQFFPILALSQYWEQENAEQQSLNI